MTSQEAEDHKLALAVHEELNGFELLDPLSDDHPAAGSTPLVPREDTSGDADLARDLQEEWEDEDESDELLNKPANRAKHDLPQQNALLLESQKRDKEFQQLCKADGAFYGVDNDEPDTSGSFDSLSDFMAYVRDAKCTVCFGKFSVSPADVTGMFNDWRRGVISRLSSEIICKHCEVVTCIFCAPRHREVSSWAKVHGQEVSWCCASGRLLLIWITLCAFDDRYYPVSLTKPEIRKIGTPTHDKILKVKKRKAKYENDTSGGVGFASHTYNYFYSSHYQEQARKKSDAAATRARKVQVDDDTFGSMVLKLLASLLPVLTGGTNFDDEPPGAVSDLLLKSKVLDYSAALLRNDSLDDVSARQIVYEDLFKLVSSLHEHHTTSELVYNDRLVRSNKCNLLSLSFQDISGVPDDERESIFNSLRNLATQSSLVVQHAHKKDFNTRDEQGLVKLARRIDELWQLLIVNSLEPTVKPTNNNATQLEAKAVPITDVPDKDILASHYFKKKANALKEAPLGRMKRLITEVTTLTTGLPPGIYVRYGSDRPDVMKAIIIGPVGTPYENGIFEFDIFCDANFPNTSPQVQFKTTGGGSASFNPNLYDNGKVCLSLLGTWAGEPWNPNQSTLLQVLVSIQAMILCEEPWYNEPGRERRRNDQSSNDYNKIIRSLTVKYAILDFAERPPPLWSDIIKYHFKQNVKSILQTIQVWTKLDVGTVNDIGSDFVHTHQPLTSMQEPLQNAMRKFGSTIELSIIHPPAMQGLKSLPPVNALIPPFGHPDWSYPMAAHGPGDQCVNSPDIGNTKSLAGQGRTYDSGGYRDVRSTVNILFPSAPSYNSTGRGNTLAPIGTLGAFQVGVTPPNPFVSAPEANSSPPTPAGGGTTSDIAGSGGTHARSWQAVRDARVQRIGTSRGRRGAGAASSTTGFPPFTLPNSASRGGRGAGAASSTDVFPPVSLPDSAFRGGRSSSRGGSTAPHSNPPNGGGNPYGDWIDGS